jgi:type II secretory pathway component PulF
VRFSAKELSLFYSQLSTMLGAGVPIHQSLSTLLKTSPRRMRSAVEVLLGAVRKGKQFNEGMILCGKRFPATDQLAISICERSGALERGLASLADYHEKSNHARNKIISASTYPILLLIAGVFICRLPDLVLGELGKINYTLGHYLRDTLGFLLGLVALAFSIYWLFKLGFKIPGLKLTLDKLIRRIPVWGAFQMDYTLSRWVQSVRLLLNAGHGVVEALDISTPLVASPMIVHAYSKARPLINDPMSVSEAFESTGLFRPILIQFWSTGELSGKMDDMLEKLTDHFENEWRRHLDNLTAWIPRIIYGIVMMVLAMQIFRLAGQVIQSSQEFLDN